MSEKEKEILEDAVKETANEAIEENNAGNNEEPELSPEEKLQKELDDLKANLEKAASDEGYSSVQQMLEQEKISRAQYDKSFGDKKN